MVNRLIVAVTLSLLVSTSGCLLIDGTDGHSTSTQVQFSTTEREYRPIVITGIGVFLNLEIATRLKNTGDDDVALTGCMRPNRPILQKLVDGEWVTVYAVAEPECISPPFYVAPGEVFEDTLSIAAVLDPNVVPEALWDNGIPVDGRYRLERMIYRAETQSGFPQEQLPLAERVTRTFEIHPRYGPTN